MLVPVIQLDDLIFLLIHFSPMLPFFSPMSSSKSIKTYFNCPRWTGSLILPGYVLFTFLVSIQTTFCLEISSDLFPTIWFGWVPLLRALTSSCIYFINCTPACVLVSVTRRELLTWPQPCHFISEISGLSTAPWTWWVFSEWWINTYLMGCLKIKWD